MYSDPRNRARRMRRNLQLRNSAGILREPRLLRSGGGARGSNSDSTRVCPCCGYGSDAFMRSGAIMVWLAAVAGAAPLYAGGADAGGGPRFVRSPEILLDYSPAGGAPVERVELWVSTDAGRSWKAVEHRSAGAHTLHYTAPA